jgi:hypothetical protein
MTHVRALPHHEKVLTRSLALRTIYYVSSTKSKALKDKDASNQNGILKLRGDACLIGKPYITWKHGGIANILSTAVDFSIVKV